MVAAATLLAYWGRGEWFSPDDLGYAIRLATQPLGHALLHPPPNKYLIATPLLVYNGGFEAFGIDSYVPYRVAGILLILVSAGLLFALLRRRVGDYYAIPPTVLMLFFGAGWESVITPQRLPSQFALAAGLAMMLALERRDLRGDVAAMVLLAVSLSSHPIGIAFAAAAAVMIPLRSTDGWRGLWVVIAPGTLFAAWWLFLRPPTTPTLVPNRASDIFPFVRESWAALTAAVTGLFGALDQPPFHQPAAWIAAGALLALIVLGVAWSWRRLPPTFWAALVGLVVMMATTRLSPGGFLRVPDEPRYLYPEAFFLLVALGCLAAALRLPDWGMWLASAVLLVSLWPNIDRLHDAGRDERHTSEIYRAKWSAVEFAGASARPGYMPDVYSFPASEYLAAVRAYGSGGYSAASLAARSNDARSEADRALVDALGVGLEPVGGAASAARRCHRVSAGRSVELTLPEGGAWIGPGPLSGATLSLGRFGDRPTIPLTPPAHKGAAALRIPPDRAGVPWRILIESQRPVTVCGLAGEGKP
jgi:hypothetical protein